MRSGTDGGVALKPSDRWTISLCREHHAEQHQIGETAFQMRHGIDMRALAESFAMRSPHWRKVRGAAKADSYLLKASYEM